MKQALDQELQKYDPPLRDQLRVAYETPGAKRSPEQTALLKQHPSVNISPGVLYQYIPASKEELQKFDQRLAEVRSKKPPEEFVRALVEPPDHAPPTRLFHRGDHQQPKQVVPPGGLTVAAPLDSPVVFADDDPSLPTTGRRLAFARWLTGDSNPLTARVLANRVWLHHFGKGIVDTPGDFGRLGASPSHPSLLDWLAAELMRSGWSLKHLHRVILNSAAWRQSSRRGAADDQDGANRFYARQNIRRLDAEALRDHMLSVAGQLDDAMYGPPQDISEDETGQVIVAGERSRRSIYVKARRSRPVAIMQAFDAPVMETNCERRSESTAATQSLMLMNSQFSLDIARQAAKSAMQAPLMAGNRPLNIDPRLLHPLPPIWSYGHGAVDDAQQRLASFTPFAHWTGAAWQGGPQLPDAQIGWAMLRSSGGHTSTDDYSPIRRWIAPVDGRVRISGTLHHPSPHGDGVVGLIFASGQGRLGQWMAAHGSSKTNVVDSIQVHGGDTLDFVTRCGDTVTSDSFEWRVHLDFTSATGQVKAYDSEADFSSEGPGSSDFLHAGPLLAAWRLVLRRDPSDEEWRITENFISEQLQEMRLSPPASDTSPALQAVTNLCQTLLSSNEFLYVD